LSDLIAIFLDAPSSGAGLGADTPLTIAAFYPDVASLYVGLHTDDIVSGWAGIESWPGTAPVPPTPFPVITPPGPTAVLAPSVSAGLGEANTVGALSVPATWTAATPAVRPVALALPATSVTTAGEALEAGSGSTFSEMALAGMAGRAMAGTLGTGGGRDGGKAAAGKRVAARAGGVATTAEDAAAAGEDAAQDSPRTVVTGIAAEIRELAKLRDEGILTEEEFSEQKRRLLGR
ncbi:MAG TPA: SHOCT domain-containing protein, partial [Mycobacterium sp.]|nr:SHOCT domain-containing protein [Mycobacterium sp.]